MRLRAKKHLFICIILGLVLLSCRLPFFGKTPESKNNQPNTIPSTGPTPADALAETPDGATPQQNSGGSDVKSRNLSLVGQLGGSAKAVAVTGQMAVLGQGPRLALLDVSKPQNPVLLGESEVLSGLVMGVAVSGSYVYAATMYGGLNILNVSKPAHPPLLSSIAPQISGCDDILVDADVAYLACNPGGLFVVDVTDPEKPRVLYEEAQPVGAAFTIVKSGNYLYLVNTSTSALDIFNVENPRQITREGSLPYSRIFSAGAQIGMITSARACGKYLCFGSTAGLIILSLEDPLNPAVLNRLEGIIVSGLAVHENRLYLADDITGIHIVDITDINHPYEIGQLSSTVGGWELSVVEIGERGMFVADNNLYISDPTYGLTIADVENPESPVRIGSYMTPLPDVAAKLRLQGNHAFIASRHSGFRTVDISNPSRLKELAYDDQRKNLYTQNPSGLVIRDHFAFLSDNNYPFHVYDITDPARPVQIGEVFDKAASDGAYDLVLNGDFAYLSGWGLKDAFYPGNGIWVIDIKDPRHPQAINFVEVFNEKWDLSLSNNTLFALDKTVDEKQPQPISLRIFDLSNPQMPREVYDLAIPEIKNNMGPALFTEKDRLYISIPMQGVLVYDISKPAEPKKITTISIMTGAGGAYKTGTYLLFSGISMYSIADVLKPEYVGSYSVLQATDFAVKEDLIFVGTAFQGLYVLRFSPLP